MKSLFSQRNALIGLALASTGLACSLAHAQQAHAPFETVVVKYSDLNLDNPDGAQILYRRIKIAARQACSRHIVKDLAVFTQYRECYDTAVANAVTAVQSARVSELRQNETQHPHTT